MKNRGVRNRGGPGRIFDNGRQKVIHNELLRILCVDKFS